jgi:NDP-4-keto-2,6-dideoxyhexose 3-C-methyltransferase
MITERSCRACDGPLDTVLAWGNLDLSDFPLPDESPKGNAPLDFCACRTCGLVQLRHTVDPDILFRQYWYLSGVNEAMQAELASIAEQAVNWIRHWTTSDLIVDVGANDGTGLAAFRQLRPTTLRVAFEPALNLAGPLYRQADVVVPSYFPAGLEQARGMDGRVKILTSIACMYASDEPRQFVWAVDQLLHADGLWVLQFQDLHQMLQATAFDNITWEHLWYPSLAAIERLLVGTNLYVVEVERRAINGGSLRLLVQRKDKAIWPSVGKFRSVEEGCESWDTLQRFAWRVTERTRQIQGLLKHLQQQGKVVDLYGASTKGNTLQQVVGIGPAQIRQAWERTPEKIGRKTVTGIPIVSEEAGRADPPDAMICGIWQHRPHVLQRESTYLASGRSLIFPLPTVDVVLEKADAVAS